MTGAAGHVARLILDGLRPAFRLRRVDLVEHEGREDDEVLRADAADVGLMTECCSDASAVLHLAAKPFEDDFLSVLLPRNLVGTWAVFEAARRAGVARVVFASTGQTMGGNPPGTPLSPTAPPRPISVYAATKLFGEALGRYYADQHGMQVACLRLGWVVPPDSPLFESEPTLPELWCAPADLVRLVLGALTTEESFATVLAMSHPGAARADTTNPYGWAPAEWPTGWDRG